MLTFYRFFLLGTLLSGLVAPAAHAQMARPGYVVLPAGDTLRGIVSDQGARGNAQRCLFRSGPAAIATTYLPEQLRGFGLASGKVYDSKVVATGNSSARPTFLEALGRGAASLYAFRNDADTEEFFLVAAGAVPVPLLNHTAVVKVDGTSYEHSDKFYLKTLSEAFRQCLSLQAQLSKVRFTRADLADIVYRYNVCVGGPITLAPKLRLPNKLTLALTAGLETSNLHYRNESGNPETVAAGKAAPVFGLALQLEFPSTSKSFAARLEALYEAQRYEGMYEYALGSFGFQQQFRIATSYLRLPLLVRYTYPHGMVRPFAEAGAVLALALTTEQEQRTRNINFGSGNYSNWAPLISSSQLVRYEQGFVGGLGLTLNRPDEHQLSLQVRGEVGNSFSSGTAYYLTVNRAFVLLGYNLTK